MRRFVAVTVVGLAPLVISGVLAAQGAAPAVKLPPPGLSWAYGIAPDAPLPGAARAGGAGGGARAGGAPAPAPAPDPTMHSVPGSTLQFTRAQIGGAGNTAPADWFPGDHPTMPDVVAKGRGADVRACSLCHYPNGKGRPENAGVAGLAGVATSCRR